MPRKLNRGKKPMQGNGFFSDMGSGLLAGITLGAVRTGAAENLGFLPFGSNGFLGGIKPSQIAAATGNPAAAAGLAVVGKGKQRGGCGRCQAGKGKGKKAKPKVPVQRTLGFAMRQASLTPIY